MKPYRSTLVLLLFAASPSHAGLADRKGIWDFDSSFAGYFPSYTPINAASLTAGTDYSFASDGSGYTFLQTQPFTTAAKRLIVTNPTGANGGGGATRTNRWSIVMDVKFDAFQPYSGLVQLNPDNTTDVSIYLYSADNVTATLSANGTASAIGAFTKNIWYRLAITCGNDGAGGALTLKCYINGVLSGSRPATFDTAYAMRSTFLLFSDETAGGGELKPTKISSLGLWGEELSAADIATLGGPQPAGILPQGLVDPASPPLTDSTISPTAPYIHGANIGWIHARPSADWGVVIGEHVASGFAHSANCGWITFGDASPANGIRYSNANGSDSGVNHDGFGNLSGLTWGANIGWINFGTGTDGAPRPTTDVYRPRFDLLTGQFSGFAYGANVGWINLSTLKAGTIAIPDTDGDGIADAWERQNFTYLTTASASTDADGDGISDKNEYLALTDPKDANSRLRIISQTLGTGPTPPWSLTFTSNPGRVYRVEKSATLGSWTPGPFFAASSGTQTTTSFTETLLTRDFVRIAASVPLQP